LYDNTVACSIWGDVRPTSYLISEWAMRPHPEWNSYYQKARFKTVPDYLFKHIKKLDMTVLISEHEPYSDIRAILRDFLDLQLKYSRWTHLSVRVRINPQPHNPHYGTEWYDTKSGAQTGQAISFKTSRLDIATAVIAPEYEVRQDHWSVPGRCTRAFKPDHIR
jgi:hypothetical protein